MCAPGLLVLLACLALAPPELRGPPAAHAAAGKGVIDSRLEAQTTAAGRRAAVREVRHDLRARWVRLIASWSEIEPERGRYDGAALARLDGLVRDLDRAGVHVILTTCYLPRWASDQRFWDDPPPSYAKGYQPFYPIRRGALDDYGRFGRLLARRYGGRIHALESWNEPNLWGYIYPQRTARDADFGPRTYLRMLKAFTHGVRTSGRRVRVIAGATSPVGLNDALRTSPQRFARFLKRNGAARFFDGYSHHPYTPGGSVHHDPGSRPNDPRTTVTLANLRTLLRLFPAKPFYLTEYGYNTEPCIYFGGFWVSEAQQARYLKKAYALAGKYRQVRALFWYLITDARPGIGPADRGVYTGLRRPDGSKKPSWFAYRGVR